MNHEETLTGLIEKYRRNREAVPIDVLKTKYAVAYNKLCDSIKDELKYIALQFPPWITGRQIRVEYADEIIELFNRLYAEGEYSKKLGRAAFKDMNPAEAIRIAADESDRSIFQSASVFFLATFGVYVSCDISIIRSICALLARGALISAAVIMICLPPVLVLCEGLINKTSVGWRTAKKKKERAK